MDTMEDILADCNEVFRYDETRPQDRAHHRRGNSQGAGHHARRGVDMRFEITEVHVVDIPDSEVEEMDNPLEEIKDDAHWFIEQYARESWCEEVTRLGRQL